MRLRRRCRGEGLLGPLSWLLLFCPIFPEPLLLGLRGGRCLYWVEALSGSLWLKSCAHVVAFAYVSILYCVRKKGPGDA